MVRPLQRNMIFSILPREVTLPWHWLYPTLFRFCSLGGEPVKTFGNFVGIVTGCALGTCVFLTIVIFVTGDPLKDWLESSLGLFVQRQPEVLDNLTREAAVAMVERGLIITPDGLIGGITNLYGNMIQVLVGVFALFGILSFFAIRWQSIQQAEALVESKLEKAFNSDEFNKRLNDAASKAFDLQSESIHETLAEFSTLDERISAIEVRFAESAPEDEPSDEEATEQ